MNASQKNNLLDKKKRQSRQRRRLILDVLARHGIRVGGLSVILAITLIFFYLLFIVLPLFEAASLEQKISYQLPGGNKAETLHIAIEEQAEMAVRYLHDGKVIFFRTANGQIVDSMELAIPQGEKITAFSAADPDTSIVALGLSNGSVLLVRHGYDVSYPGDIRKLTPKIIYPAGQDPLVINGIQDSAVKNLALQVEEESVTLVVLNENDRITLNSFETFESLLEEENVMLDGDQAEIDYHGVEISHLLVNKEQRHLFIVDQAGFIAYYDITDKQEPELIDRVQVIEHGQLTQVKFLAGSSSLLIASDQGIVKQWMLVRDEQNIYQLTSFRVFDDAGINVQFIAPEYFRKSFATLNEDGLLGLIHATAERTVLLEVTELVDVSRMMFSPRANLLLVESELRSNITTWRVHNEHPEISWSSLWGKVWYEGYQEPDYIWQSSSASNDFEPKFSLVPLTFGTIKAAFYAMLLAMPLAILGAIYTAYFMAPKIRQSVKPTIEIMEALPTVILGFLAGLWLAPFIESNLPGIFSLSIVLPLGVLIFAYAWTSAPPSIRQLVPDGWTPVLLLPVVGVLIYISFAASPVIENQLFGGDFPIWLRDELGIDFDQRNSIIIGIAMGFAVIPTIFSIAEDAIFSVPKHLSMGSLALGATPWQTFMGVVILTASPGIFSAVMICFCRAVGETMIVLMATGNTPVMDLSIFQGMRTLSANIAVEMPESEVHSTHYRVLFLAALVLFAFTFLFNTFAEIVRQRLRKKYGSL